MAMFYSQPRVGVATSFSFSQMLVVVSTLGGIFLLKEKKTKKQYISIAIGIVLIIAAAFYSVMQKNNKEEIQCILI